MKHQTSYLDTVRSRLGWIWFIGAGLIFIVMIMQSLLGNYRTSTADLTQQAWSWLLPTLMPSVGLIVTVLSYSALDPNVSAFVVRKNFVTVATGFSIFYLFTVLITLAIQPIAAPSDPEKAIGLMHTSNLWLGPLQGVVASAIGVLFTSKEPDRQTIPAAGATPPSVVTSSSSPELQQPSSH